MDHLSATTLATAAGWLGAGGTVVAYTLLTTDRIAARSRTFQGLNAAGAALLALSAATHSSWPSTAVNLTWMLIGLAALVGAGRVAQPDRPSTPTAADAPSTPVLAGGTRTASSGARVG
ncbi:hypothetical protein [uncultured Nocardioides sp.]|uniref:CBU_0592 family membrane protein n=1 Tax=uncultured Nocardioides sp. TaxID=198441 RepID=UPI002616DC40|nr:hypothetical protein [uncultured Nocardioides sp.]